MHEQLKEKTYLANIELQRQKLVIRTWGNVSQIDRGCGVVAIKPSGVSYEQLDAEEMVLVDLDGKVLEGSLKPSSDTAAHLELYRNFESIGGVCHTHSANATIWAQSCKSIPCFGTTHADYFYGAVPVTEKLTEEQIKNDYVLNIGKAIVARFAEIEPMQIPAVLVANHGPFTWGKDAAAAVENAVVLEQIAAMALGTVALNPDQPPIDSALLDKHFLRKHGKNTYYGQK